MRLLAKFILLVLLLTGLMAGSTRYSFSATTENWLRSASDYLDQEQYYLAMQDAERALKNAMNSTEQSMAYGIKGRGLLIMQRYGEARESLLKALELAHDKKHKANYANSLGVLSQKTHDFINARFFFQQAAENVEDDPVLALSIQLNQLHIQQEHPDVGSLQAILEKISSIDAIDPRVKFYLNLAAIARMRNSSAYTPIISQALEHAYRDSTAVKDQSLRAEAYDSLAELYESQGNHLQALSLSELASAQAQSASTDDLMIQIEWRKGRIYEQLGQDDEALVAFGKAVDHIQTIRRDIPVYYEDGQSSFRQTLAPIYLAYTNQLLKKSHRQNEIEKQHTLVLARQTIELIKQSELEDFLGGRCLIEGLQREELDNFDAQAAILYPILLPDRLELLLGIGKRIQQFSIAVPEKQLGNAISSLSSQLRQWVMSPGDIDDPDAYRQSAENLYQWVVAPIERELERANIKTLVFVPDSMLRLVPFAALFDGKKYLIEKYAVSISPGISLLGNRNKNPVANFQALLAGMSKLGPVLEKLSATMLGNLLLVESQHVDSPVVTRSLPHYRIRGSGSNKEVSTASQYFDSQIAQQRMNLPGVETELSSLKDKLKSTLLLNEKFTVANFSEQISKQSFDIIHIASHGIFSSDADKSFVMAFDDILKLDDLKHFLKQSTTSKKSIQLLTFSACQTAEGDDRAPLGFAGAALRADAQSALGSLWPISDDATSQLMISFYSNLIKHQSKAEALRQAQLELLKSEYMYHPAYWSPFILVGNWL